MEIRQLRYFQAIARCGSFSRASAELHIAQPALSSQVAALEAELGAQLFVRHSRGVELTDAGRLLEGRAEAILLSIGEVVRDIQSLGGVSSFEVRLGLPTTLASVLSIPLLQAVAGAGRGMVLQIIEGMTGHLEKWLEQSDIDIAVLFDRPAAGGAVHAEIGMERLVLVGRDTGAFEGRKEVQFRELANVPLIHTTRAHQLRRMIQKYSMETRVPLDVIAEIDSLGQIKSFLYTKDAFTILPESIILEWTQAGIQSWPITMPELIMIDQVIPSAKFERHPKAAAVLDLITRVARQTIEIGAWPGAMLTRDQHPESIILSGAGAR